MRLYIGYKFVEHKSWLKELTKKRVTVGRTRSGIEVQKIFKLPGMT